MVEVIAREREVERQTMEKEKQVEQQRKEIADVIRERIAVEKTVAEQEEKIKEVRLLEDARRTKEALIVTAEGVEERHPKSEEEWQSVKAAAVNLTETGNLLMIAPRAQDGGQWIKNVQAMMAQGQRMIEAIDRKDTKQMFDVGSDLYDTCTNCHMHYMPAIKDLYR